MKYAIIGGGISGLSIANMISEKNGEVILFEKESRPGGLIKCENVDGALFHCTGGHVFNTKRIDVLDWFWKHFDKEKEFVKALRNSVVAMNEEKMIPYPIENHMFFFDKDIQTSFIADLLSIARRGDEFEARNFEEFLQGRFGKTLYQIYFQPYNYKVWRRDLTKVPLSWLAGKLPMPTVEEIIYNNMNHVEEREFVHSSFYYPCRGGSQFIADRLAKDLTIRYDSDIKEINRKGNHWLINGELADKVIFCGNIKQLPLLLKNAVDILPNNTLFISKKNDKYGFVDKNGNVVVDYIYDDATKQNEYGYCGIKKDGKWGAIDNKGNVVIEPTYNLDDYLMIDFIGRWHFGKDINMNYYNQL